MSWVTAQIIYRTVSCKDRPHSNDINNVNNSNVTTSTKPSVKLTVQCISGRSHSLTGRSVSGGLFIFRCFHVLDSVKCFYFLFAVFNNGVKKLPGYCKPSINCAGACGCQPMRGRTEPGGRANQELTKHMPPLSLHHSLPHTHTQHQPAFCMNTELPVRSMNATDRCGKIFDFFNRNTRSNHSQIRDQGKSCCCFLIFLTPLKQKQSFKDAPQYPHRPLG